MISKKRKACIYGCCKENKDRDEDIRFIIGTAIVTVIIGVVMVYLFMAKRGML